MFAVLGNLMFVTAGMGEEVSRDQLNPILRLERKRVVFLAPGASNEIE